MSINFWGTSAALVLGLSCFGARGADAEPTPPRPEPNGNPEVAPPKQPKNEHGQVKRDDSYLLHSKPYAPPAYEPSRDNADPGPKNENIGLDPDRINPIQLPTTPPPVPQQQPAGAGAGAAVGSGR